MPLLSIDMSATDGPRTNLSVMRNSWPYLAAKRTNRDGKSACRSELIFSLINGKNVLKIFTNVARTVQWLEFIYKMKIIGNSRTIWFNSLVRIHWWIFLTDFFSNTLNNNCNKSLEYTLHTSIWTGKNRRYFFRSHTRYTFGRTEKQQEKWLNTDKIHCRKQGKTEKLLVCITPSKITFSFSVHSTYIHCIGIMLHDRTSLYAQL